MAKITAEAADKMYEEWYASGTDQEFADYFGLDFHELAEIARVVRENKEKTGQ